MSKLLSWLDKNLLAAWLGFLLFFIPLWPKLPLFDVLPGYIVRIRVEDFMILIGIGIWVIWLARKKIHLFPNPLLKPVIIYLAIGMISILSALLITHTVLPEKIHLAKSVLHWLRRIEYFSLFFIFYSAIDSRKIAQKYITVSFITLAIVALYGFGQKYIALPVISTMNREFSKGMILYLRENTRVNSTFAGHYDLAAYLVILIPLVIAFFFIKTKKVKLGLGILFLSALSTLNLTVSRISFIAAFLASAVVIYFFHKKYREGLFIKRLFAISLFFILSMFLFGDLAQRFETVVRPAPFIQKYLQPRFPQLFPKSPIPVIPYEKQRQPSDQPPAPKQGNKSIIFAANPQIMSDVVIGTTQSRETSPSATPSASIEYVIPEIAHERRFVPWDLSISIRFEAEWPRAWQGFLVNPLLGQGYGTLNRATIGDFSYAESTDNDYLRMLGETGILGLVSFLFILFILAKNIWNLMWRTKDRFSFAISCAFLAAFLGVLINAFLIDLFEASKFAYVFWAISGIILALTKPNLKDNNEKDI